MPIRFTTQLLTFPNGGETLVPVCSDDDEALMHFLHSDSGYFRGDGRSRLENILAGRVDEDLISGGRTVLSLRQHTTTITDAYKDPDRGIGFPELTLKTPELLENIEAWIDTETKHRALSHSSNDAPEAPQTTST